MPFPALPKEFMGVFLSHHESTIGESKLHREGDSLMEVGMRVAEHMMMILARMMKNKNTKFCFVQF